MLLQAITSKSIKIKYSPCKASMLALTEHTCKICLEALLSIAKGEEAAACETEYQAI